MLFDGNFVQVLAPQDGVAELVFNNKQRSVNVISMEAMAEFGQSIDALRGQADITGLLVTSSKDSFILGADITEFLGMFSSSEADIVAYLNTAYQIFNGLEDLPFPTVALINGDALGGGFEVCLATDFRVCAQSAKVGLPEIKLGIIPGFGGSVRLPRLIGAENALEWIATGKIQKAPVAMKAHAVDAVVESESLRAAGLDLVAQCQLGKIDYQAKRALKQDKLQLSEVEAAMAFETAKAVVFSKAGPHFPAPMAIVDKIKRGSQCQRDQALEIEAATFAKLAKTDVCQALVGLFLNSQLLKKLSKQAMAAALPVKRAAVLGAGIMGGGICYQSALKGIPVTMKDIAEDALALGMAEATKQLRKRVERGRMDIGQMASVIAAIKPSLTMHDVSDANVIVEAVVENPKVKCEVLAEVEKAVSDEAVITSNTSTISIDLLSAALEKPERFCGMHFFNPVPVMPLVEVIRGEKTSDQTVATVVAYAAAMGKTPVVVNNCPGFYVNRVLFPYFFGFNLLVRDGADFRQVDKVMEGFGWPMGPAYLQDVVGIDTCHHCVDVIAEGYPDRMSMTETSVLDLMFAEKRLGQKNGKGFYRYEMDRKGKPKKIFDENVQNIIGKAQSATRDFTNEEIVGRMMIPLCIEAVRCLEEGIVGTPAEADMALIMGIGFPQYLGGAFRYIDTLGLATFCAMADSFAALGPLYQPTAGMREMANAGKTYFQ